MRRPVKILTKTMLNYKTIATENVLCPDKKARIAFVEKFLNLPPNEFGGTSYRPIFSAHNGSYIEPKELNNGDIVYFHEGEIKEIERRKVSDQHDGTMEFKLFETTKFTFGKECVVIEQAESSCHIDGTELGYPDTENNGFGQSGFGRWNDNSTGMWDWD